mmetsp:Transcript_41468/g.125583  ORF Transcript_41468/g.125583 Transcript_41468/m.125583 type:complete len:224 (+) Transcript_41468:2964-3635(+)
MPTSVLPATILQTPSANSRSISRKVLGPNQVPPLDPGWLLESSTTARGLEVSSKTEEEGSDREEGNMSSGCMRHDWPFPLASSRDERNSRTLLREVDVHTLTFAPPPPSSFFSLPTSPPTSAFFSFALSSRLHSISHSLRSGHSRQGTPHGPLTSPPSPSLNGAKRASSASSHKARAASHMGRYPVQRHRLPSRCSSTLAVLAWSPEKRAYMDTMMPGVQKPH